MTKSKKRGDTPSKLQLSVTLRLETEDLEQIKKLSERLDIPIDVFCSNLVLLALGEIDKTVFISTHAHKYEQESARKVLSYYKTIRRMKLEIQQLRESINSANRHINNNGL